MPVDDLWYLARRDPETGERKKSKRYGRGKRYRVRYIDDDGEPRARLFERKAAAETFDANVRADVSRGQYIDPRAGKKTVQEYAERWREDQLHDPATAERLEGALRLHVYPKLGRLPMAEVRNSNVKRWVKDRATVLAPSTLRVVYGYVLTMFASAVADKVIASSPCVGVRLPPVPGSDYYIPTAEEVHALSEALPPRFRAVPYVAAGCGLRWGEVFGLERPAVEFLRREVDVRQQLKTSKGGPFLAAPKTLTSRRTVEMGEVVGHVLGEHVKEYPPVPVEIDDRIDPRKPRRRAAPLLFVDDKDRPLWRVTWSRVWKPAVEAAGLPEGFGLHGLRHYFATLLIHNGASVKTVQLALGHSKPTVTLNTYVSEWPEAIDRTRSLVDNALGWKVSDPEEHRGS